MKRLLSLLLLLPAGALAQTAPIANSINTTNAGQASGTVLNSNQQINQVPLMMQEYGAGYRCQNSTVSFSPYYVGSNANWTDAGANGFGGMVSLTVPLDARGVETCMSMAKARVAKEQFDLEIVRALRCTDLLKAGAVLTTPKTKQLCEGIAVNPAVIGRNGGAMPLAPLQPKPQELILTR